MVRPRSIPLPAVIDRIDRERINEVRKKYPHELNGLPVDVVDAGLRMLRDDLRFIKQSRKAARAVNVIGGLCGDELKAKLEALRTESTAAKRGIGFPQAPPDCCGG